MIRRLDKDDWQYWKKIRLEALKKSPDSFLSCLEDELKFSDQNWADQLEKSSKFGYFLDDKIIGCCGILIEGASKISHTATLFGMYVSEDARGDGVGFALVSFAKTYAKNNRVKQLYLGCNAENLSAVRLYRRSGFKIYGTRPDYTRISDRFCDDLLMMCEI